jgi:hypothetical protein
MEENKSCTNCGSDKGKNGHCCGHHCCGKGLKIIMIIVVLVIVFCLGSLYGRNNNKLRYGYPGFMMNSFYGPKDNTNNSATGSATVEVLPPQKTDTKTNTPPVLE